MPIHEFMTYAAFFTAAVQIIFVINLFWSMKKGAKAPGESVGSDDARMDRFRRRRRSIISPACIRWSITARTSTACPARRRITSCRPIRRLTPGTVKH